MRKTFADPKENENQITERDVIYTCYMIECVSRLSLLRNRDTIDIIGMDGIKDILYSRDWYSHYHPREAAEMIKDEYEVKDGNFVITNVNPQNYIGIPDEWRMGQKYGELVIDTKLSEETYTEAIFRVYHNPICDVIDDYNCNAFEEIRPNIKIAYEIGYFE